MDVRGHGGPDICQLGPFLCFSSSLQILQKVVHYSLNNSFWITELLKRQHHPYIHGVSHQGDFGVVSDKYFGWLQSQVRCRLTSKRMSCVSWMFVMATKRGKGLEHAHCYWQVRFPDFNLPFHKFRRKTVLWVHTHFNFISVFFKDISVFQVWTH